MRKDGACCGVLPNSEAVFNELGLGRGANLNTQPPTARGTPTRLASCIVPI